MLRVIPLLVSLSALCVRQVLCSGWRPWSASSNYPWEMLASPLAVVKVNKIRILLVLVNVSQWRHAPLDMLSYALVWQSKTLVPMFLSLMFSLFSSVFYSSLLAALRPWQIPSALQQAELQRAFQSSRPRIAQRANRRKRRHGIWEWMNGWRKWWNEVKGYVNGHRRTNATKWRRSNICENGMPLRSTKHTKGTSKHMRTLDKRNRNN